MDNPIFNLVISILPTIISFIVGLLTGYFGRGAVDQIKERDKRNLNNANTFVLVIVTVVWALSVFVDIISPTYETSPLIHGLMGAIVGFFFKPWQSNNNNQSNDKGGKK